jgi:hypothetical protein
VEFFTTAAAPDSARLWGMSERASQFGRKALALLVLLVAVWILFKVVLGVVAFLATIIVVVLAIAAIVWAVRVL